jgi:ATP-dependent Lon protease
MALYSAMSQRILDKNTAMTGEISLHGNVLPVGGLREKCLAAKRAGFTRILYPACQLRDIEKLDSEISATLELVPIAHISEALDILVHQAQTVSIL